MGTCRVVIEPEPHSGVRNMSVDEAMLEAAIEDGKCTLRWYRWETATISLGYFQQPASTTAPELVGLPVVRRLTGGGAILHHREWTYSVAIGAEHPLARDPGRIYELVHGRIVATLAAEGICASLRGQSLPEREGTFLCFGRGDPRDIVLCGHKIVGSAQRRRRGAVLQHGSLLLQSSHFAPQFPGVLDLAPNFRPDGEFVTRLGLSTGSVFGQTIFASQQTAFIEDRARQLDRRYQTLDWTRASP